jgi:hypothetical protein
LDEAGRLRILQSALLLANKPVRNNIRLSYSRNKRYYDQRAKARTLKDGDVVYVHNTARKPGVSQNLTPVWTGPCRIRKSFGHLNFCVEDTRGNETLIHINHLKLANERSIRRSKREAPCPCRRSRSQLEEEVVGVPTVTRHRPILIHVPQVANPITPIRELPGELRTPEEAQVRETPKLELTDRNYVPPGTPRSRRELGTDRQEPPMTRSRTRLQMEPNVGEA